MNEFRKWISLCEKTEILPTPSAIRKKSKILAPDTIEFKNWFGNSKVVDRKGNPLICYHGTFGNFHTFNPEYGHTGLIFFSANPKMANGYANGVTSADGEKNVGAKILPVYLHMIKPYDYRIADNESIAHAFYRAYGGIGDYDARAIRIALYGKRDVEDDNNPDITDDFLEIDEFITALQQGDYPALENFDFLDFLKRQGYDGIITYEVKSTNYGVFDAKQIKSVFAKEFNFDSANISENNKTNRHRNQIKIF